MPEELAALEGQPAHGSGESEPLRPPDTGAGACEPETARAEIDQLQVAVAARARDGGHAPESVSDEQAAPGPATRSTNPALLRAGKGFLAGFVTSHMLRLP